MNANELADEFKNRQNWKLINYIHWSEQSETMLRQQQAEIDIVKKLLFDEQIPNELMAHWNPLHSTLASRLRKA